MPISTNPIKVLSQIKAELLKFVAISFLILFVVFAIIEWWVGKNLKIYWNIFLLAYFLVCAWLVTGWSIYFGRLKEKIDLLNKATAWDLWNPNEILNAAETLYRYLHFVYILRYPVKTLCKEETWERYKIMWEIQTEKTLLTLRKLIDETKNAIEKQKTVLKNQQKELNEMVWLHHKNGVVGYISTARIDHQIKQFEELQKVLVKI